MESSTSVALIGKQLHKSPSKVTAPTRAEVGVKQPVNTALTKAENLVCNKGLQRERSRSRDATRDSQFDMKSSPIPFQFTPPHFADVTGEVNLLLSERDVLRKAFRDAHFEFNGRRMIPYLVLADEDLLAARERIAKSSGGSTSPDPSGSGPTLRTRRIVRNADVPDCASRKGRLGRPKIKAEPCSDSKTLASKSKRKQSAKLAGTPVGAVPQMPTQTLGDPERRSSRLQQLQEQQQVKKEDSPKRAPSRSFARSSMRAHGKERRGQTKLGPANSDNVDSDDVQDQNAAKEARREKKPHIGTQSKAKGSTAPPLEALEPVATGFVVAESRTEFLTPQEKFKLQAKIDQLNDDQIERVIAFLALDLGDGSDGQEVSLDLDLLLPGRQHALVAFVDDEIRSAQPAVVKGAVTKGLPLAPPITKREDAATTARHVIEATQRIGAKQLAWDACSVREVQRQSHLKEVQELVSASGAPHSTPAGAAPAQSQKKPT